MRWQDESYVRVFKRTTPDWSMVPGPARSLFYTILREVDRAGMLSIKKGLPSLARIIDWPQALFEEFFPYLLDDGCVRIEGELLIVPNFAEAQYCKGRRANSTPDSEQRRFAARRRRIYSTGVARRIFARDRFACRYCRCSVSLTVDHVVPLVGGGCDSESNLVAACRPCNSRKGGRTPESAGMPLKEVQS